MKFAVFGASLLAVIPLGILLRSHQRLQLPLWTLIGLLPFTILGWLDINLISYEQYRGDSRGIEITLLDLLVLAQWLAVPRRTGLLPFRGARLAYLAIAISSVSQATEALFSWFSIWKLLRMYLVFHVISSASRANAEVPGALLRGMALGVLFQGGAALVQRYALGFHQTPGFFAHQNTLGTAVNLLVPVCLAWALGGRARGFLPAAAALGGGLAVVLSLSRGSLAMLFFVTAITFALSVARAFTPRKLGVAALVLVGSIIVFFKASDTIAGRFASAPAESALAREAFEDASARMLRDHPLGIGINQYSLVVKADGYWQDAVQDRGLSEAGEYGGLAHNIYWLTTAELGIAGLLAFLWLLAEPVVRAAWWSWQHRGRLRGDILLGFAVSLVGLGAHGALEWTFRQTTISYLFWIQLALVGVLAQPVLATKPGDPGQPARTRLPRQRPAWVLGGVTRAGPVGAEGG